MASKKPVGPLEENQSPESDGKFKLNRGAIRSLNIYEINEYELTIFENGGTSSTALSFAMFLLSSAVSFTIVLYTVDLTQNERMYNSFFTIALVGFVLGVYMMVNWYRTRTSDRAIGAKVRSRIGADC